MNAREKIIFSAGRLLDRGFQDDILRGFAKSPAPDKGRAFSRFIDLYRHAFLNVPYYRRKYEAAGLASNSIQEPGDVDRIPPLTKAEFGEELMVQSGPRFAVALESGGTGGRKASTYLGLDYVAKRYCMLLKNLYSLGWEMGRPVAALHPVEYGYWNNFFGMMKRGQASKAVFEFIQQYVIYRIFHDRKNIYYSGNIFENLSDAHALEKASAGKPFLVIGRPDVLNFLVKRALSGIPVPRTIAKVLVVGNLSVSSSMKRMGDFFGCKTVNMYASTEAGYVGLSCGHCGEWVHVDDLNYLVEIDPVQDGEIIVTDFNNYGMPLIRYRTGDVGEMAFKTCPCARQGPMLKIRGRKNRYIENDGGEKFFDSEIMNFFEDFPFLWAYQMTSDPGGGTVVRVRPRDISRRRVEDVLDGFCEKYGLERDKFRCDLTSPLIKSPSGKLQCIAASG